MRNATSKTLIKRLPAKPPFYVIGKPPREIKKDQKIYKVKAIVKKGDKSYLRMEEVSRKKKKKKVRRRKVTRRNSFFDFDIPI